ncbi:MAG: hypothetical protein RL115_2248 [Bacteroidota bacterium]|jgi:hypothetical protein
MAGLVLPLADANVKPKPSAFNEYCNGTALMYPDINSCKAIHTVALGLFVAEGGYVYPFALEIVLYKSVSKQR